MSTKNEFNSELILKSFLYFYCRSGQKVSRKQHLIRASKWIQTNLKSTFHIRRLFPMLDLVYISVTLIQFPFQYETRKEGEVVLEGSNASAEEVDEGTDENSTSGIDIVLNHRLVETGFGDKKGFTAYLKAYMKKVLKYLEENDRTAEIDEFKSNINNVMKEMMGKFKDLQFFTGKTIHALII